MQLQHYFSILIYYINYSIYTIIYIITEQKGCKRKKYAKGKEVEKSYKNMKILGQKKGSHQMDNFWIKIGVWEAQAYGCIKETETENFVCMKTNMELPKLGKLIKKLEKVYNI